MMEFDTKSEGGESQLLEVDEINMFSWVERDSDEKKLRTLLRGLSRSQKRQVVSQCKARKYAALVNIVITILLFV
jgi:hypothetical protein